SINTLRLQGIPVDEGIVRGAMNCLRPILMASLVAILGLLPASLATGLGSDVQRPLATVIVWGLFSSMILTLFVVPLAYRIMLPSLPPPPAELGESEARFMEPLPDVHVSDIIGLLEYLHAHDGETEVYRAADETNREFGHLIAIVKAAEMLGWVET